LVHLVTGGAGFIAVTLIKKLLEKGHTVLALDNLTRGNIAYIEPFLKNPSFTFAKVDCADLPTFRTGLLSALNGRRVSDLWHMAANSDIPAGGADANVDLRDTFMTSFNAVVLMNEQRIPTIHFASSSAVYGDFGRTEIAETSGPCTPISNYGAMKLASEAQISAAVELFAVRANIFRFPNVVGVPATHGVIFDLLNKLKKDPSILPVLGDGTQQKSYLHVSDLVDAMLFIAEHGQNKLNIFNIGATDVGATVRFIAETVKATASPTAHIQYGVGDKGWPGDVPRFRYSVKKLTDLGWSPRMNSEQALRLAIKEIAAQMGM
jgi:UDP-glucose 4-epimerase